MKIFTGYSTFSIPEEKIIREYQEKFDVNITEEYCSIAKSSAISQAIRNMIKEKILLDSMVPKYPSHSISITDLNYKVRDPMLPPNKQIIGVSWGEGAKEPKEYTIDHHNVLVELGTLKHIFGVEIDVNEYGLLGDENQLQNERLVFAKAEIVNPRTFCMFVEE